MHALLNFIILGKRLCPLPRLYPSFFEIRLYFKNMKLYNSIQCVPRRHKNKHRSELASFEEYWYASEYKAPLNSTSIPISSSLAPLWASVNSQQLCGRSLAVAVLVAVSACSSLIASLGNFRSDEPIARLRLSGAARLRLSA